MLPMRFFRSRAFSAGNAAIFFAVGALFCGVFFIAQFLQVALGRGPLGAGLGLLPWTATLFFVAPVAGALVDRLGERPFLVLGPLLQAVGMGWLALIAEAGMPYGADDRAADDRRRRDLDVVPGRADRRRRRRAAEAIGKASGTNTTLRELGGVFGIAISVAFFGAAGGYASPTDFADGFAAAMGVSAALSLLAVVRGARCSRPAGGSARRRRSAPSRERALPCAGARARRVAGIGHSSSAGVDARGARRHR